jgi:hypothetical protein
MNLIILFSLLFLYDQSRIFYWSNVFYNNKKNSWHLNYFFSYSALWFNVLITSLRQDDLQLIEWLLHDYSISSSLKGH